MGRMAAGGHFLSDVLWSALIALGGAHLLYYYVLRIPQQEASACGGAPVAASRGWQVAIAILAAMGGAIVLLALFAAPHGTRITTNIQLSRLPHAPKVFEVLAGAADVEITLVDTPSSAVAIAGELHGFGLPTSELSAHALLEPKPVPTLEYRILQRGWFTDLNSNIAVRLPADGFRRLIVHLDRGDIRVTDATRASVVHSGRLALELQTRAGVVQRPRGAKGLQRQSITWRARRESNPRPSGSKTAPARTNRHEGANKMQIFRAFVAARARSCPFVRHGAVAKR
ncbi:MAG: hypothetical protein ACREU2_11560 [Steroidobacteraceae bacterium]